MKCVPAVHFENVESTYCKFGKTSITKLALNKMKNRDHICYKEKPKKSRLARRAKAFVLPNFRVHYTAHSDL